MNWINILSLILLLTLSCNIVNKAKTYKFRLATITLYQNGSYDTYCSSGTWDKKGRSYFLSSRIRPDSISNVRVEFSSSDTNKSCILRLFDFYHRVPIINYLVLQNDTGVDTLAFYFGDKDLIKVIDKSIGYNYFRVLDKRMHDEKYPYAISDTYSLKLTDTVSVYFDYPEIASRYCFFVNQEFRIKSGRFTEINH